SQLCVYPFLATGLSRLLAQRENPLHCRTSHRAQTFRSADSNEESRMKKEPHVYAGAVTLALAMGISLWSISQADPPSRPKVPALQYDPTFPKLPLPVAGQFGTPVAISTATGKPKPWVTGEVAGTCVDSQDHVFTVNRGNLISPETVTAVPSPTVIEFDAAGNVVNAFNIKAKDSTATLVPVNQAQIHGCFVDYQDNIWIGGNGNGVEVKYSHDGSTWLN